MSGSVADRKRLIRVTDEGLRTGVLRLDEHGDFFPAGDVAVEADGTPHTLRPRLEGQAPTLAGPEMLAFLERHALRVGDVLAIEKLGRGRYRLSAFESKRTRDDDWHRFLDEPLEGEGPTVLELFAGCGGMALGFKRAGYRTALAVEWDASACESLRANITHRVAQAAIQEVDRFPKVDVVAGGPPCQGFSNLGEKVPHDPRNQLWRHYLRAVAEVRPRAFVMENVPPLLKSQEYVEIVREAESLGYRVVGRVLNAADYGVPQTRKRAIIVGLLGDAEPTFPEPTHVDPAKHGQRREGVVDWITVREAIGDVPFEPTGRNWHIGRNPTPMSLDRYRAVPPGGNRWNLPDHLMPGCWKRKTQGGTDLFGRLWWDRPSVTIRTEFYKPEKGRYLHPEAHRPITHREAARLQGFPDDFAFQGTKIAVGVQIGNACPPPLAEVLARHVLTLIGSGASARAKRRRSAVRS